MKRTNELYNDRNDGTVNWRQTELSHNTSPATRNAGYDAKLLRANRGCLERVVCQVVCLFTPRLHSTPLPSTLQLLAPASSSNQRCGFGVAGATQRQFACTSTQQG